MLHLLPLFMCTTAGVEVKANYELLQYKVSGRCREVFPEDERLIRQKLEAYKAGLIPENAHLFTSVKGCTGFGTELIDAVVEHSHKIFDLAYIKRYIPVFFERYANQIVSAMSGLSLVHSPD